MAETILYVDVKSNPDVITNNSKWDLQAKEMFDKNLMLDAVAFTVDNQTIYKVSRSTEEYERAKREIETGIVMPKEDKMMNLKEQLKQIYQNYDPMD